MKTNQTTEMEKNFNRPAPLSKALDQNERIKDLVKESAEELTSVNIDLKDEIVKLDLPDEVDNTLKKNEAVERKIHHASKELEMVNRVLKEEVRERNLVDLQLAAVSEREESARQAALHDELTGLPTRALFNDRLEHGFAQARRHGWMLAVMFIDLNKFKEINDIYGHGVGDTVLKIMARRLTATTRGDDTICRYGGDEFLYLMTEIREVTNIGMIAEKIIETLKMPFEINISNVSIGASIGIAIFPNDGTTAETLIKNADVAMYKAKQSMSNYVFAT